MSDTVIWGAAAALLLCWAVGAYNRLVRARSQALQAFGALAMQLQRFVVLAHACEADTALQQGAAGSEDLASARAGLQAATGQFAASLGAAKAKPLDAEAVAALGAARGVLVMAWQRLEQVAQAMVPPLLAEPVRSDWAQISLQVQGSAEEFNQTVRHYNAAVSQFPAQLLAWIFGFRAARPL